LKINSRGRTAVHFKLNFPNASNESDVIPEGKRNTALPRRERKRERETPRKSWHRHKNFSQLSTIYLRRVPRHSARRDLRFLSFPAIFSSIAGIYL